MNIKSLTGQDTLIVNGRIITGLVDANAVDLTFPNDISAVKRGKDGNVIYAKNEMGRMASMTVRISLGCEDDKYLNSLIQLWKQNPSTFTLLTGSFIKNIGDGASGVQSKVHQLSGGTFKNLPEALTSAEGNTDQSVAVYTITWGDCDISVQ